jgi:hypothetical protein
MDTHYFWAQNPNVAIRTLMRWRLSGCEYVHPLAEHKLDDGGYTMHIGLVFPSRYDVETHNPVATLIETRGPLTYGLHYAQLVAPAGPVLYVV